MAKKKEVTHSCAIYCGYCPLNRSKNGSNLDCVQHEYDHPLRAIKAIMDYEPPVDWSKVAVDTKILVRDEGDTIWAKRHFAEFKDGKVYAFCDGRTSFSDTSSPSLSGYEYAKWEYAKLYEGDNNEGKQEGQ